jgi:hypothetical protein
MGAGNSTSPHAPDFVLTTVTLDPRAVGAAITALRYGGSPRGSMARREFDRKESPYPAPEAGFSLRCASNAPTRSPAVRRSANAGAAAFERSSHWTSSIATILKSFSPLLPRVSPS